MITTRHPGVGTSLRRLHLSVSGFVAFLVNVELAGVLLKPSV